MTSRLMIALGVLALVTNPRPLGAQQIDVHPYLQSASPTSIFIV